MYLRVKLEIHHLHLYESILYSSLAHYVADQSTMQVQSLTLINFFAVNKIYCMNSFLFAPHGLCCPILVDSLFSEEIFYINF